LRPSALVLLLVVPLYGEAQDRLISGPGSTLTENKCRVCHELQHIRRTPLSRGEWEDNVRNMRERGAPLTDAEAAVIVDYLAIYYNREKPAPPPAPDTLAAGSDDPVQKLLAAHGCLGCHSLDSRVVGPSFREVAKRYSADAAAAARLSQKIRDGGQGVWGQVPMPANPGVSGEEARQLAGWILGQK
jgi:cytochrome c551/c552